MRVMVIAMTDMNGRRARSLLMVVVLLVSVAALAGCTSPFPNGRQYPCDCGGCSYEGTELRANEQLFLTIDTSSGQDLTNLTNTTLEIVVEDREGVYMAWDMRAPYIAAEEGSARVTLGFEMVARGEERMSEWRDLAEGVATDLTLSLHINSADRTLDKKTFFNGSNTMDGTIMMEGAGDELYLTMGSDFGGVSVIETERGDGQRLVVDTGEMSFELVFMNMVMCADCGC